MSIGHVETVAQGYVVASVMVLGTVGLWPASTAMLTRLVPVLGARKVYGINFMMLNAGLGLGGPDQRPDHRPGVGGELPAALPHRRRDVPRPPGRRSSACPGAPAARPPRQENPDDTESMAQVGWSVVLRDRTLLRVVG